MNLPRKKAPTAAQPANRTVQIGHREFIRAMQALPLYDSLRRQIGTWADVTLEAMYAQMAGTKSYIQAMDRQGAFDVAAGKLQRELDVVGNSGRFIQALFHRARTGSLGLRSHAMAPADFGRQPHESELEEAIRWIVFASNSTRGMEPGERGSPHARLRHAMLFAIQQRDVRDLRTLHELHAGAVSQATDAVSRGIPAERSVKYGSSGAAGYLQDGIGDYAMSFPKPAQDDPKWDDLACFLLGAHMRAHGFADGNGRAVRCLYACTLLQGGREFVAPTYDFENQLHGL